MEGIQLSSGNSIPQIGLGTWQLQGAQCIKAVKEALTMGYNHIDTAIAYENHKEVGQGIKESHRKRDSFYLTTKIPMETLSYKQVISRAETALTELQTDYVDLLLIHWPTRDVPLEETLLAFNELRQKGLTRDIGISNFNKELAKTAQDLSSAPLVINQVEFHPLLFQRELLLACEDLAMRITAYSPLARGEVLKNEVLKEIGRILHGTAAQISIAWLKRKGIIIIPKSSSKKHLETNLKAMEIELREEEMAAIDNIQEQIRMVDGDWKHYHF